MIDGRKDLEFLCIVAMYLFDVYLSLSLFMCLMSSTCSHSFSRRISEIVLCSACENKNRTPLHHASVDGRVGTAQSPCVSGCACLSPG